MKFDDFEIHASPFFTRAYCRECRDSLLEVSNGWFSRAMFCPKCKNVYLIKLVKVPNKKVTKEFLEQAEREAKRVTGGFSPPVPTPPGMRVRTGRFPEPAGP